MKSTISVNIGPKRQRIKTQSRIINALVKYNRSQGTKKKNDATVKSFWGRMSNFGLQKNTKNSNVTRAKTLLERLDRTNQSTSFEITAQFNSSLW